MAQASFLLLKDIAPGGIIAFSGIQALNPKDKNIDLDLKRRTPMMLVHGYYDPILPLKLAQITYEYYD